MFKKNAPLRMLGLVLAALFLMSALPVQAQLSVPEQSTEQAPQTTVKKKKAVKKKASKKAKKKKTSSKASKKKTAAKKAAPAATAAAVAAPAAATAADVTPTVATTEVTSTATVGTQQALLATVPATGSKGMGGKALPSAKATPTEVVRQFYNNLSETMKQGDSLGFSGRSQKLRASLERSFNMDEMMRTAAGPSWNTASPEQQKQMVAAFRNFSLSNYANRFARYEGEQFEVIGEKPGVREGEKVVETRLVSGSDSTDMNYVMRRDGKGQWKIVDVYVNGTISEMATRRSEFGSVLRQQGVDALLQLLNEKSSSLANS
jgi:phospholipid transport system substrate-binding protein